MELVCRGGGEGGRERGGVSLTSLSLLSTADAEVVCMHREIGALPAELKFRIQKLIHSCFKLREICQMELLIGLV